MDADIAAILSSVQEPLEAHKLVLRRIAPLGRIQGRATLISLALSVAVCNLAIMTLREYDPRAKLLCGVSMVEGCEFHRLAASHEGSRSRGKLF